MSFLLSALTFPKTPLPRGRQESCPGSVTGINLTRTSTRPPVCLITYIVMATLNSVMIRSLGAGNPQTSDFG